MKLTDRQVRMLQLLDKQVKNCSNCDLKKNGTAIPFWTDESKYVIIGEAPGANEVRQQTPFVGQAGKILTENLSKVGFDPKDFLIINTVQCRPVKEHKNGKPTDIQLNTCQSYLRKYIKVVNPEKILCLGNYAKYLFTGNYSGVLAQRGMFNQFTLDGDDRTFPVLFTVHPAYCIYSEEGIDMLQMDIQLFKESNFERPVDWLFTEDDFMLD